MALIYVTIVYYKFRTIKLACKQVSINLHRYTPNLVYQNYCLKLLFMSKLAFSMFQIAVINIMNS